jgi:mannose-6-phosphate isomerase-like protein (cupin superfamily)
MGKIRMKKLEDTVPAEGVIKKEILPGEIEGVKTSRVILRNAESTSVSNSDQYSSVLIFINGKGRIEFGTSVKQITEKAVFVPSINQSYVVKAEFGNLEYLEVIIELRKDDIKDAETYKDKLPFFRRYSDCKTYREAIKSEKTVSRDLVREEMVPRFCMGSVETTGPDMVGAHRHPWLEQLFFGLEGNDCILRADDAEVTFGENVIVHVPLASKHLVRVEEGKILHYLWMDFFIDKKGLAWVKKEHHHEDQ